MEEVGKNGRTVIFVSHNMNAVEQLCTSALLLERGLVKRDNRDVRAVIKGYLFDRDSQVQSSQWINPGHEYQNPWFKPSTFLITDENGQPHAMPVSNNAEIWVQVEAELEELDPALTVGYALYTEGGDLLYWSYQTDAASNQWPQLQRGPCILRSRIPSRFLNEGSYKLELAGGLHFREWLFEPGVKAPSISMTIQGGLSDSAYWMIRRPGLLAPVMPWERVA
jgi:lipopolysaccharide transport system ATP-binding protein